MIRRKLIKRPSVIQDIIGQAAFIAQESPAAAIRFVDAVEETFERLVEIPGVGSSRSYLHPLLQDLRCWHVRGFTKVLIFYRFDEETVEIVRLIHGSQDIPTQLQDDPDLQWLPD